MRQQPEHFLSQKFKQFLFQHCVPLLIVHGTADEVIPFRHGEQLAAAAPAGSQFVRVDGARHMESLTRADVQRRVLEAMVAAVR